MTVHSNAGGRLLLELNRLLRPGGYFVWSATPVYQNKDEDVDIWKGDKIILFLNFFKMQIFTDCNTSVSQG